MPIDYSRYPPNWKSEIVPAVLGRARYSCEVCGVRNRTALYSFELTLEGKTRRVWIKDDGDAVRFKALTGENGKIVHVVLTVAHLDHDETNPNVSIERLAAMCQWCHLNYDADEKARRRKDQNNATQENLFGPEDEGSDLG
jgi:hypothetical protein